MEAVKKRHLAAMAQSDHNEDWKEGQEVEIYDPSQEKWVLGTIYHIQQNDDQNIYCVEYEEYSKEIHEKDAHSLMRIPQNNNDSNDDDAEEAFLNSYNQITTKLPLSRQIHILSEKARKIATQRMMYLYIEEASTRSLPSLK